MKRWLRRILHAKPIDIPIFNRLIIHVSTMADLPGIGIAFNHHKFKGGPHFYGMLLNILIWDFLITLRIGADE